MPVYLNGLYPSRTTKSHKINASPYNARYSN